MLKGNQVAIFIINLVKVSELEELFVVEEGSFSLHFRVVCIDLGHHHIDQNSCKYYREGSQ